MAKIRTDFPGQLSATPTSNDEKCSQMHAWNHTSGQIAPHPRFTHELHGTARSHLNLSLIINEECVGDYNCIARIPSTLSATEACCTFSTFLRWAVVTS